MLTYTGIFDLIENRFYSPALSENLLRQAARDAESLSKILTGLHEQFSSSLREPAVRRSLLPGQDAADMYARFGIFSLLHESVPALHSVRFVDSGGDRILFSTQPGDFAVLPAGEPRIPAQEEARLVLNKTGDGIIFSFPLYDSHDVYCGTALFAVSKRILTEAIADDIAFVAAPPGFVCSLPAKSADAILAGVSAVWAEGYRSVIPLVFPDTELSLVSVPMDEGYYFGRIYSGTALAFPQPARAVIIAAVFLTVFLIIFFLFSFKRIPPNSKEVIMEQDGIHYINSKAIDGDEHIDKNFINLVDSVVGKK